MVQISQFCHRIDGSDITNSKFESFNIHECPEKCQKIFSMVDAAPPNGFLDEAVTANSQAPGKPWELNPQRLATVQEEVTVEQRFRDAETIVEFALDEDGRLLRNGPSKQLKFSTS
ncbi:Uncharacterized protein TCM_025792 [Theobroma cacao]|uniref:Uncharacterized protein n=1 Tax=Theobroma cacao TaxID=3641 RepID=A0A061EZ93_THECC|nr:Uncharacterized protein TCM_025792 [Theobroma cacao]